jgi:hypothetical protein
MKVEKYYAPIHVIGYCGDFFMNVFGFLTFLLLFF